LGNGGSLGVKTARQFEKGAIPKETGIAPNFDSGNLHSSRKITEPVKRETADAAAEAVARRSYGKLVAFLAARTRDVAAAEDALSEAFASALVDWPAHGVPENPEGWLLTVARRKSIDTIRSQKRGELAGDDLKILAEGLEAAARESEIPDQRLALLFACAHPAVEAAIRAPLMMQAVLGLDAARIASAFLVSPTAMGQRLVRAKEKIRQAGIPFRIPQRDELRERVDAVLGAIYAAFSEGWSDAAGTDAARRDLAEEAIYLGTVVTDLLPTEPEALGLLALMLHAEARRAARRDARGNFVPLAEQDPALWNAAMIDRAESLLKSARALGVVGRYQLEAALQSAHVYRRRSGADTWLDILKIYDVLMAISASPVVAVNRALAVAEVRGRRAALAALDDAAQDKRLSEYQPYWATRAELLARCGEREAACSAYEMAIGLERDEAVRRFLLKRMQELQVA
jgi:RNA polymerase sigma-70 factor (ECF subfamily)